MSGMPYYDYDVLGITSTILSVAKCWFC